MSLGQPQRPSEAFSATLLAPSLANKEKIVALMGIERRELGNFSDDFEARLSKKYDDLSQLFGDGQNTDLFLLTEGTEDVGYLLLEQRPVGDEQMLTVVNWFLRREKRKISSIKSVIPIIREAAERRGVTRIAWSGSGMTSDTYEKHADDLPPAEGAGNFSLSLDEFTTENILAKMREQVRKSVLDAQ